jgi:hypothetical protein
MFESYYSDVDIANLKCRLDEAFLAAKNMPWDSRGAKLQSLGFSEREFLIMVDSMSNTGLLDIEDYSWNWHRSDIVTKSLSLYTKHLEGILSSCNDPYFARSLMRDGTVKLSEIKFMAKSKSKEVRKVVAEICSVETLRAMTTDSSLSVRKTVFARLGPVDYIDQMLDDKSADIRYMGLEFAPRNYKKLSAMIGEISHKVFYLLIEKIRREDLPLLLSNRNLKDKHIASLFERRMQSGS